MTIHSNANLSVSPEFLSRYHHKARNLDRLILLVENDPVLARSIGENVRIIQIPPFSELGKKGLPFYITKLFIAAVNAAKEESPDIIDSMDTYLSGLVAFLVSRLFRKRLVVFLRGFDEVRHWFLLDMARPGQLSMMRLIYGNLLRAIDRFLFRNADLVVAKSDHLSAYAKKNGAKNVFMAPTGVDPLIFDVAQGRSSSSDSPKILFAGTFIPRKCPDLLIDAFKIVRSRFRNIELEMIGTGPMIDVLNDRIAAENLQADVSILDEMDQRDLADRMASATVFVLPSVLEGTPCVLMEAIVIGVPIVSTRISSISKLLQDGAFGTLVEPGSVNSLAEGIIEALQNIEEKRSLAQDARNYALEHLLMSKIESAISREYLRLLH